VTPIDADHADGGVTASSHVRVSSRDILRGEREIVILHAGSEYRLRITRADKLILTK
jgi:hemin uptake protein HemP